MSVRELARRVPIDVYAALAIALFLIITHIPVIQTGMCFNDPTWLFHFGRKTLYGAVPYRDYVWQVGPLPIYVDAAFQGVFGDRYVASLFAGLAITFGRATTVWMVARRLAGVRPAIGVALFCCLDPIFAFAHHWSTPYAELFITLSALFLVLGVRASGRAELVHFALAGAAAALVIASRQSSWVLISLVMLVATTVWLVRKDEQMTKRRYIALWAGFTAALALFAIVLALLGVLGPALQQMFLDAPQKKGIHGLDAVLDAISGGALVDGRFHSRWRGFAFFIGFPLLTIAGATYAAAKDVKVSTSTLAWLAFPALFLLALAQRDGAFEITTDLPRTALSVIGGLAVLSPERVRRWFGVDPLVVLGLGLLPLASDWALEMSFPGRGWGDVPALVTAGVLLALASRHIPARTKTTLCAALAIATVVHVWVARRHGYNPFAKEEAVDGKLSEHTEAPRIRGAHSPQLRGMRMPAWRAAALAWLGSKVPAHSTCFVYANLPSLYDLLDCENPTRIDTTIADFPSVEDAEQAAAALKANPPDVILAHDRMWMSPAISLDLGGDITRYDSWNPKASFALHMGLRAIIDQYESLGTVGEALGPAYAEEAAKRWDTIDQVHVYRRKR